MAEVPVLSRWPAQQRRLASLGSTLAAAALLGFALLAGLLAPASAGGFLLAVLILLLAVAVFQGLVVATGLRGPGAALPAEAAPAITLKCSECGTIFDVPDTGQRPLRHACPGCGREGELTEAELAAPPELARAAPAQATAATITLKCGNCGTVFDLADTGERPLRHTCPGCGAEGELKEEVAEPAPAPPPRPAPPAPKPARTVTVKTLRLRCKNCSTVFTLRDTSERPLYHECPGCKATGVLR